jgi:hypothetical protein
MLQKGPKYNACVFLWPKRKLSVNELIEEVHFMGIIHQIFHFATAIPFVSYHRTENIL